MDAVRHFIEIHPVMVLAVTALLWLAGKLFIEPHPELEREREEQEFRRKYPRGIEE